jgi:hypothetical protein
LLKYNADVHAPDNCGWTPLNLAVQMEKVAVAVLLEKAMAEQPTPPQAPAPSLE